MGKAKYCVFIGRFQPIHDAHLKVIAEALKEAENLILVVGSYRSPRTLKNPWSFAQRKEMIEQSLPANTLSRVRIIPVRDYLYSDITWLTGVQNVISQSVGGCNDVKIIGHFKDNSSYYLKLFPQWELIQQPNYYGANSTDIRRVMFEEAADVGVWGVTPEGVKDYVANYIQTDEFAALQSEYNFIKKYQERWASVPFPPTFVTTDAVVVQAGHVLVVKRGRNPGIGKYALPGGFISPKESILRSTLRELKEETEIVYPKSSLKNALRETKVFDHPSRDARGRTITHGHYFRIDELGPLPKVRGADDASEALWMPLSDLTLHEEDFYSDHLHIINYFVHNVGR